MVGATDSVVQLVGIPASSVNPPPTNSLSYPVGYLTFTPVGSTGQVTLQNAFQAVSGAVTQLTTQTSQTVSGNAQTIAVGTYGSTVIVNTAAANLTGMILATGVAGQIFTVVNAPAYTLAWAASATSNVFTGPVIASGVAQSYIWDGTNSIWRLMNLIN